MAVGAIWHRGYVRHTCCSNGSPLSSGILQETPLPQVNVDPSQCYYMPYTERVKLNSTSTKVRVVFEISARTINGPSLNEIMYPGPKLQVDLIPHLIRFRSHPFVLSADIRKFFTQIELAEDQTDYQRLVYRDRPDKPLGHFKMTRVMFGVTAAPFLAIRSLHHLFDEQCSDPAIIQIIKQDALVDNILTGCDTLEGALYIQHMLRSTMSKGQFHLCKWASNKQELLDSIPSEDREIENVLRISDSTGLPTFGVLWNPSTDEFYMSVPPAHCSLPHTKRSVLSQISKFYDPLGWVSPVNIGPKILIQELWKNKSDWDSPLPNNLSGKWISYLEELPTLAQFKLSRCYTIPSSDGNPQYDLIGFSDASNQAYAAVAYIRTRYPEGHAHISLVGSKTKVAPIQGDTTPRLELNGAKLLSRFLKTIITSVSIPFHLVVCYTDSTSVLGWLTQNSDSQAKNEVYVNNRVRSIHSNLPSAMWKHVSGLDNPADCASRGISAAEFLEHPLWMQGPPWLFTTQFSNTEATAIHTAMVEQNSVQELVSKCSSIRRMKRTVGFMLRFIHNTRNLTEKRTGPLIATELSHALITIVRVVQGESFSEDFRQIIKKRLSKTKQIKALAPFIDKQGLLRVGGRLRHSEAKMEMKHPLLLPDKHNFTEQYARHFYVKNLHAGPTLLLCLLREQFWIIRGSTLVKKIVRQCVRCHRSAPRPLQQIMNDLPAPRVTQSRPFTHTGMDFAGPFTLCVIPGRKPRLTKSYICVYVCIAVKAVHLELVGDLSTASFLASLDRFTSRRGRPRALYSDGGKNFVGAKTDLDHVVDFLNSAKFQDEVTIYTAEIGVEFHFNPPASPHHGGLFEAAVKSTKYHIRRALLNQHLSIEEFRTLLCLVEAALNLRPITPMSSDPSDFGALTPAHFLIGDSIQAIPSSDLTGIKDNRLTRWEKSRKLFQGYWKRFHVEYLQLLQSRSKWHQDQPNVEVGTLVLLKESEAAFSTHKWIMARVTQTFPGPDGRVRVVEVKTPNGSLFRRSIVKIAPLPMYN